ncbi:MAG: MoaD/ThiS family protein [Luteimonas sp.]
MTTVTVLYFASLRDTAGRSSELVDTDAGNLRTLYEELEARHGFGLACDVLRVAVDGAFAKWQDAVGERQEIAFIPPVSGG